jgi:hypothetical protein
MGYAGRRIELICKRCAGAGLALSVHNKTARIRGFSAGHGEGVLPKGNVNVVERAADVEKRRRVIDWRRERFPAANDD